MFNKMPLVRFSPVFSLKLLNSRRDTDWNPSCAEIVFLQAGRIVVPFDASRSGRTSAPADAS